MRLSRRTFVGALGGGVAGLASWPAGIGPIAAAGRASTLPFDTIKLDGNENPYGLGPAALEAIQRALPLAPRYLRNAETLVEVLARRHAVEPSWVLLSAGSGDLLRASVDRFTSPDRALVVPEPTYEAPATAARRLRRPLRAVPLDAELRLDLPALTEAAAGAGLLYLCNPNNPTSTSVGGDGVATLVRALAARAPETTVLVDEAYADYAADPGYRSAIDLARLNPRVVVIRTFSKIFAMAGLRVGYAIAQPGTLGVLRAALPIMTLNVLGIAAATAAVGDTAHLATQVALNRDTRARTVQTFEKLGYRVARSETNFVMVDVRQPSPEFQARCAAHGVFVGRPFPPLDTWSRITIGTADEMTRALEVFTGVLRPSTA